MSGASGSAAKYEMSKERIHLINAEWLRRRELQGLKPVLSGHFDVAVETATYKGRL